jgi:hypothetical protein
MVMRCQAAAFTWIVENPLFPKGRREFGMRGYAPICSVFRVDNLKPAAPISACPTAADSLAQVG